MVVSLDFLVNMIQYAIAVLISFLYKSIVLQNQPMFLNKKENKELPPIDLLEVSVLNYQIEEDRYVSVSKSCCRFVTLL